MRNRNLWSMVALAAVLLLAAGCSSDDGGDAAVIDSSPVTEESDEPAAEQPEEEPGPETAEPADAANDEGAADDPGALLLVMDASGSMNSEDDGGQTLLEGAKRALVDVVEGLPEGQHVGLRVYGHRYPNTDKENGCTDTELIHPVEPLDRPAMIDTINGYDAMGYTPIGLSLEEGVNDLPPEGRRTMILVSDGEETCDTDVCEVAERVREEDIELVINTVGFGLGDNDQAREELECIAEAGGGSFVDIGDAGELAGAIQDAAREDRSFQAAGGELVGAPIPRDANTGQLDTPYTDTVLGTEDNFYRFEVTPGSEVRGEVVVEPNPSAQCSSLGPLDRMTVDVHFTNAAGSKARPFSGSDRGRPSRGAIVVHTQPIVVEGFSEFWLHVETSCREAADEEFDIEVQITRLN